MAGIYEFWRRPAADQDDLLVSCAILTTAATDGLGHYHERMPVQIVPRNWADWLDPELTDSAAALALVSLPEPGQLLSHPVSTRVNRVGNDGPDLVQPLAAW